MIHADGDTTQNKNKHQPQHVAMLGCTRLHSSPLNRKASLSNAGDRLAASSTTHQAQLHGQEQRIISFVSSTKTRGPTPQLSPFSRKIDVVEERLFEPVYAMSRRLAHLPSAATPGDMLPRLKSEAGLIWPMGGPPPPPNLNPVSTRMSRSRTPPLGRACCCPLAAIDLLGASCPLSPASSPSALSRPASSPSSP